jgi:glycosyltransferase involved in cell wall biosynthesis
MPKVVVTLPAYRAALTVGKTVADVPADYADDMILVDDASPDDTVALARALGLTVHVHTENRGYGANLKTCYLRALEQGADVIVVLHPDYQYDPKAVPLLIAPILGGDADMTFGSRFAGIGDPRAGGMPLYRFLGNRITTIVQNAFLGTRFSEMHSGMRAYTRSCLLSLPFLSYSDDFVFESQILVDAVIRRHRVVEVPIPTRYTLESSSLGLVRLFKYVWETITHTTRQTLRWGRRGRRWPVVGTRDTELPADIVNHPFRGAKEARAIPEDVAARIVESLLLRLGAYLLPGSTVALVAGSEEWLQRLMTAAGWGSGEDPTKQADVVIAFGDSIESGVSTAHDSLHAEGMLALIVPKRTSGAGSKSTPKSLAVSLRREGFHLIEWEPLMGAARDWSLALARPIEDPAKG